MSSSAVAIILSFAALAIYGYSAYYMNFNREYQKDPTT